ncbi:hypothetical protein BpHYR1_053538 [Brachionus plicatilis]|uniref:Uncharacterized protein n=1 Tax=Brachionus plicatilis TaxID=10195 RepID=A0A3M7PJP7_BRAPC|nr:hypothetical protein BpHYR1_053538 [Brachionus plicatilis]
MNINNKFETIKTEKMDNMSSQKPSLVTLSNESTSNSSNGSPASSNIDLTQKTKPDFKFTRSTSSGYYSSPISSATTPSSRFSYNNTFLYEDPITVSSNQAFQEDPESKGCCLECGTYTFLIRFNDLKVCEKCYEIQWENEINELLKMKNFLENGVSDMKKYLGAKKSQCNDNIRNSQQIKKFINMTMQQIKRKIELELENKRDELFSSIDAFVDNQKKINSSINEDTFQTSERICEQIENFLLNTENEINLMKLKSIKSYAKVNLQKLNQQRTSRVPIYSIFFVPDSTVQVSNTFGKIVLKSFDPNSNDNQTVISEFNDLASFKESYLDEFSFLNQSSSSQFDPSQAYMPKLSKWTSSDNFLDSEMPTARRGITPRYNDPSLVTKRNKSLFTRVPSYNPESYKGIEEMKAKVSESEKKEENGNSRPKDDFPAYVTPVKLNLSRNVSQKLPNGNFDSKKDEQKPSLITKTSFKQQITNQGQGPKLVNF